MTIRRLDPEEYPRLLQETEVQYLPDPDASIVWVKEEDGKIIWCWTLIQSMTLDGLWTHPDHRDGTGARAALQALADMRSLGIPGVATVTAEPTVQAMAERLGFQPVPGTLLIKRF